MLDQLLQQQGKKGVALNPNQVTRLPLNDWYNRTSMLQSYNLDPKLYLNRSTLLETYGRHIVSMNRCCRDAAGKLKTDYASVLLAARYANSVNHCPYLERVLLNTTLYALGSADIYANLKLLQENSTKDKYYPVFRPYGEVFLPKDHNNLATMTLMAYITKPEGALSFVISAYDVIKQSYLHDLLGWSDKKLAKFTQQGNTVRFMPLIPEMWELKLAPRIFSFEYGMIDQALVQVINNYKAGKLLKYREGLRGRKPITENPYLERIYPTVKRVLSERIERFATQANNLGLQDRYNFYYTTPHYAAVSIAPADRVLFRDLLNSVYARPLFNLSSTVLANGEFI